MEELTTISNLYKILSNAQFNVQFIYFCCGYYNNIDLYTEFQSKGIYYIIGKLTYDIKLEIINYINYLIILIENKNSVLNLQNNITTINNLHSVLNSQNKDHFLMFLYGFLNDREDWASCSQYGDSYIIGKIISLQENKIYIFCKFMIDGGNINGGNINGGNINGSNINGGNINGGNINGGNINGGNIDGGNVYGGNVYVGGNVDDMAIIEE